MSQKRIKVLIIDDSALVRNILEKGLSLDPTLDIVGSAPDVYIGRDKIIELNPDVVTLDIEMPKMDGLEFLKRLMPQYPIPVVVVSSLTQRGKEITLKALEYGAIDFVPKPSSDVASGLSSMLLELRTKIKIASYANISHWKIGHINSDKFRIKYNPTSLSESTDKVIAIGSSTGGTEALRKILPMFPANTPGIVIAQHMPSGFTNAFAKSLNEACSMEVKEAENDDRVRLGRILIAPGDFHLTVFRSGGYYQAKLLKTDKVNGHRPSVDVLMHSVAKYVGKNAVGIMLTGMGGDGAKGMKDMKDQGAYNVAQDENTSVIYGMPKVAVDHGGVNKILPLNDIPENILNYLSKLKCEV